MGLRRLWIQLDGLIKVSYGLVIFPYGEVGTTPVVVSDDKLRG